MGIQVNAKGTEPMRPKSNDWRAPIFGKYQLYYLEIIDIHNGIKTIPKQPPPPT